MKDILQLVALNNISTIRIDNFYYHTGQKDWYIKNRKIQNNMLVYCLQGEGYYEINSIKYPVKAGRVMIIPHDMWHNACQNERNFVQVMAVRFSCIDSQNNEVFPIKSVVYDSVDNEMFKGVLENIYNYKLRNRYENDMIINQTMKSFFILLYNEMIFNKNSKNKSIIKEVNLIIDENIKNDKKLSLDFFLEKYKLSQYRFLKMFKEYNNTSFRDYVFGKKMEYSAKLLEETTLSIKEIADKLSYSDQYIFSNEFKHFFSISPSRFRKLIIIS